MSKKVLCSISMGFVFLLSSISGTALAVDMEDRVCPRVVNRFSNDEVMWNRVNDRIENRFGFRCAKESGQSSTYRPSIISKPKFEPANESLRQCVSSDWICTDWSECKDGYQERSCQLIAQCSGWQSTKPTYTKSCHDNSKLAEMGRNIEAWKLLHEEMFELAERYSKQGDVAREGFVKLDSLEDIYIKLYNEYIGYYNKQVTHENRIKIIEGEMKSLVEIPLKSMPLFYY